MIDLTPVDVRKKKGDFRRIMRGYDPALVDDFLDLVADRLEQVVRENLALAEQARRQEQQVTEYRERERALTEALVTAQEMREEIRKQSTREAELAKRTAEQEAAELRGSVEQEAQQLRGVAQQEAHQLRAAVQQEVQQLRDTAQREVEQLRNKAQREVEQLRTTAQRDVEQLLAAAERDAAQLRATAEQEAMQLRGSALLDRERGEEALRRLRVRQQQFLTTYQSFLERELSELSALGRTLSETPEAAMEVSQTSSMPADLMGLAALAGAAAATGSSAVALEAPEPAPPAPPAAAAEAAGAEEPDRTAAPEIAAMDGHTDAPAAAGPLPEFSTDLLTEPTLPAGRSSDPFADMPEFSERSEGAPLLEFDAGIGDLDALAAGAPLREFDAPLGDADLGGDDPEPFDALLAEPAEAADDFGLLEAPADEPWQPEPLATEDLVEESTGADSDLELYEDVAAEQSAGVPGPIGLGDAWSPPSDWEVAAPDDAAGALQEPGAELELGPDAESDDVDEDIALLLRNAEAAGYRLTELDQEVEELLLDDEMPAEDEDSSDDGWLPSLLDDER